MKGLKPTGPSPQKSLFFQQLAGAIDFLSGFYTLPEKDQEEILHFYYKKIAENIKPENSSGTKR